MTISFTNSLTGLSLLSGSNQFGVYGSDTTVESRAVRAAKAQFTMPVITPPWKEAQSSTPESTLVSAIKRMTTIIDKPSATFSSQPDILTSFTSYKALDRLRLLAEAAAKTTATSAERTQLQASFAKGLADLRGFLAQAPSDVVNLSFEQPARRVDSIALASPTSLETAGQAVVKTRDAPLPGLTGNEVFTLKLSKTGVSDVVTVDLSGTPQPPTLDSIAQAFNAAISSVPLRNADGTLALDANGNVQPRWLASFAPKKSPDGWGLSLSTMGVETVSVEQANAGDALIVATGQSSAGGPSSSQLMRFGDPTATLSRTTLATMSATDRLATEAAKLTADKPKPIAGVTPAPIEVKADIDTRAVTTDGQGFSYVVGTTAGDLNDAHSDGVEDLFLTKMDSSGNVVWQRSLGAAGPAQGAAVSIAANGDIVVAGTVSGSFDGAQSDGDMLVARFANNGDEKFSTLVRSTGSDTANAVAVGADGSIYVGGRAATGSGDAFIARLDSTGKLQERRSIDSGSSDSVNALVVAADGSLVALTREAGVARVRRIDGQSLSSDLGSVDLGSADARALAVAADGSIAVGGATSSAVSGSQVNSMSGGRDGFVARIDSTLSAVNVTYVGSSADDQVDSVTFMGSALYVGGRTTGDLGAARLGKVDGFVGRIDAATGTVQSINQFGQALLTTEPVRIAADTGGDNAIGALGLSRGAINSMPSAKLTTQANLRAGDEFSFRVDDGSTRKVVITAEDTLTTLSDRIRRLAGANITVTTALADGGRVLRIQPKPGHSIDLIAGAEGKDALAKIGLEPASIIVPATVKANAPRVRPGGSFALDLTMALNLTTAKDASVAAGRITSAISMTQTAYRSLYWDSTKAAMVDGTNGSGTVSAYQQSQLGRYQAALDRLNSTTGNSLIGF